LVVHGRLDIALAAGAHGVHLGVRDIPPDEARRLAGDDFIVGKSLGSEEHDAPLSGIDYVTVGPIFPLAERRGGDVLGVERLGAIAQSLSVPVVAIGGISAHSAQAVLRAGASGVALISEIFGARDPEAATRAVRAAIGT
jgi:thiamine-phosphate diphosphorylase